MSEDDLREALQRMEWACEQLAATRPQAAYDAMIDGGQAQALLELENARRAARDLLRAPAESAVYPDAEQRAVDRGELELLIQRLQERRKIMWNAPLKDGGFAKLVDPEDLREVIDWLACVLNRFDAVYSVLTAPAEARSANAGRPVPPHGSGP